MGQEIEMSCEVSAARSTVILPLHFREHIEGWVPNRRGGGLEAMPVRLLRAWAKREFIKVIAEPTPEASAVAEEVEAHPEWRPIQKALEGAGGSITLKELNKLVKAAADAGRLSQDKRNLFYQHIKQLLQRRDAQHLSVWPQLNNLKLKGFSRDATRNFVESCKELINDETGKDDAYPLLNAQIIGAGLSASLKRMWCLENESSSKSRDNRSKEQHANDPFSGRCLTLSARLGAFESLSPSRRFRMKRNRKKDVQPLTGLLELSRVLVVITPKRNAFCCFTFDLKAEEGAAPLTVEDVQELLHALTKTSGEFLLSPERWRAPGSGASAELRDPLCFVDQEDGSFDLKALGAWLTCLEQGDLLDKHGTLKIHLRGSQARERFGDLRRYRHHSSVYLRTSSTAEESVQEQLWRLCHAAGSTRYPPSSEHGAHSSSQYISQRHDTLWRAIAREGCVAMTHPGRGRDQINWSIENYHGIYLLFHLHVLIEEASLQDFSYDALKIVERHLTLYPRDGSDRLADRLRLRDSLKQLIYEMVYLNLSFNSASAGGQSEYISFLEELKESYRLGALKEELKINISELGEIVEQIEQERESARERLFDRNIAVIGSVTIPFGILSGLMGMNNFNPERVEFNTPTSLLSYFTFTSVLIASGLLTVLIFVYLSRSYRKS